MKTISQRLFHCLILTTFCALATSLATAQTITSGAVYRLVNQCSGKVLDVSEISQANGAIVHQWTDVNGLNQRWRIESTDSGFYKLTAQHSGKSLDVREAKTSNGAVVHQWDYWGGNNQQWRITSTGNGYYKLQPRHALSKALDVQWASTDNGAQVQLWTDNGSCAQRWRVEQSGGGTTPPTTPTTAPVNPNASQQAKNVLAYLYQISGNHTLSGQQNWNNSDYFTNRVAEITGKYPASTLR